MQITVTARSMDITDALKAYAENRVQRITRHSDFPIIEVHVILSIEKYRHFAEINLVGKNIDIHGKEETTDMYMAIDKVVDKVEKQLKKRKDRFIALKAKQREKGLSQPKKNSLEGQTDQQQTHKLQIVKTRSAAKPMSTQEAAMQIDTLGKDFLLFYNSDTDEFNVICKREDGIFSLVEPDFEEEEYEEESEL